jgi:ribosomal protein S27E
MAITNPVAVYNAENNVEAELICTYLDQNGIEAHPTLDDSLAGYWLFGTLPEIHKPQVWIDQSNVEAAKPLLEEYERQAVRRRSTRDEPHTGTIEVLCEECEKTTIFPASKKGTVQDCSHCGAFVDVGDDEPFDSSDS